MNDLTFQTGGDWPSTTLYDSGTEVPAAQLFVDLQAGRDEWNNPIRGGIFEGAALTAYVRPQDDPNAPIDALPGRLAMQFPGHTLVLENLHPLVELSATRVFYNNEDVTERVIDVYVDVNADDDVVKAFVTLYKPRWFGADEVITYTIIG